jgi:uncharacterized protein (DUF1697 family)
MKMVALLRGINVGGNRKISMPELCAVATKLGFTDVQSYIQSGNLVFSASRATKPTQVAVLLENAIEKNYGFRVDVIVRTASQWTEYSARAPFPSAAKTRPSLLLLGLSKLSLSSDTAAKLGERALHGEKIKVVGDAIWVDYATSVGKSKLTPAWLDKAAGSSVTMRNWNTVLKVDGMLRD